MLKVLLVDDEPFILQGLQVLVEWEKEGFETATATNGKDAINYIMNNEVDLVIADIKMPEMTGVELLKYIRSELHMDTYFVILSGYAEFSYAQEALRYGCSDYLVKPVERDILLELLRKIKWLNANSEVISKKNERMERAFLERNVIPILNGRYNSGNLNVVESRISTSSEMNYVSILLEGESAEDEETDDEKRNQLADVYELVCTYLKGNENNCFLDVYDGESLYQVGIIYSYDFAKAKNQSSREYLCELFEYVKRNTNFDITMMVGKTVNGINNISKSYGTMNMLRNLQGFHEKKDIYFYEDEYQISESGIVILKDSLDKIINAVEVNEHVKIKMSVNDFFDEMQRNNITGEIMNLNINYLLFQMINLASEFDSEVNQGEVLRLISDDTTSGDDSIRGSRRHICKMAYEYGEYLAQLRTNKSKGIIGQIEAEIKKNYSTNLTLKDLSEKYYVNSAYLGQLFRKKFGCSFKDYLNQQRIDEAAKLLIKSDMRIYEVAEAVGYKDADYFVNRFIEAKGCTPAKYRKQ